MKIFKNKKYNLVNLILICSFIFAATFSFTSQVSAEPCTGEDRSGTPIPYGCEEETGPGTPNTNPGTPNTNPGTPNTNPGTPNGMKIDAHIENPLGDSITDIPSFIEAILRFILMLGIPIVALAIIYTGFLFVTALGNSEKLKKAKQALVYTLIGAALLLGAFVIAEAIQATVVDISSTT